MVPLPALLRFTEGTRTTSSTESHAVAAAGTGFAEENDLTMMSYSVSRSEMMEKTEEVFSVLVRHPGIRGGHSVGSFLFWLAMVWDPLAHLVDLELDDSE